MIAHRRTEGQGGDLPRGVPPCFLMMYSKGQKTGHVTGFTLVEIMLVVGILALLAAHAIPNLLRSRMNTAEVVVIGACQTIAKACQGFYTRAMPHAYPQALTDLAAEPPAYLDPQLAGGQKQGYRFLYALVDAEHFELRAEPINPGWSGNRFFFLDESGVLRTRHGAPAGPGDLPLE